VILDVDVDPAEDDALPVGPMMMWLIYVECATCGAAAKQPCVGQRFGPHAGRRTRWDRASELSEVGGALER
jgi:hypothetical protein